MSDLQRFATWLVNNQDKKGTADFETVAAAFKKLDTGVTTAPVPTASIAPVTPTSSRALPNARERSLFGEAIVDPAAQVLKGAATGVRFLTDTLGADNPLSRTIGGAEDFFDSLLSAQAKRDQQEISRILKEAEDKGVGAQVAAGLNALATAPVDLIANAFGTAVPTLAAGLAGRAVGLGAKAVATGVGALTGVGVTKDAVYSAVLEELTNAGVPEEQAKEAAKEAQAYGGENLDNIALGGVLGAVAARFGLEDTLLSRVGQKLASGVSKEVVEQAAKSGLIKEASRKALEEAIPEALQGGQEQFAQNIALQREGFDVPTFRGVTAGATLEGAVGAPVGALGEVAPAAIERVREAVSPIDAEAFVEELAQQEQERRTTLREEREAAQKKKEEEEAAAQAAKKEEEEFKARQREATQEYFQRLDEASDLYTARAFQQMALETYENEQPDEVQRRVADEVYQEAIAQGLTEDEAIFLSDTRSEEAYDEALRRQYERATPQAEREEPITIDTEGDLAPDELKAFNSFIKTLEDSVKDKSQAEGEQVIDNLLTTVAEEGAGKLGLTGASEESYVRKSRALQETIAIADNMVDSTIRDGLRKAKYPSDDTEVGKVLDLMRKGRFGLKAPLKDTLEEVKQEYSKIDKKALTNIRQAQAMRDKIYRQAFTMKPGYSSTIAAGKKPEQQDPSLDLTRLAEEESLEKTYEAVSDRLSDFTEREVVSLRDVRKTKPKGRAKQAKEYFSLPNLPDPKFALYELARDVATDPEIVVQDLVSALPKGEQAAGVYRPRLTEEYIKKAVYGYEIGERGIKGDLLTNIFRGETKRTEANKSTPREAASWVINESNFSPEIKKQFQDLIREFKTQYEREVINTARQIQIDDSRKKVIEEDEQVEREEPEDVAEARRQAEALDEGDFTDEYDPDLSIVAQEQARQKRNKQARARNAAKKFTSAVNEQLMEEAGERAEAEMRERYPAGKIKKGGTTLRAAEYDALQQKYYDELVIEQRDQVRQNTRDRLQKESDAFQTYLETNPVAADIKEFKENKRKTIAKILGVSKNNRRVEEVLNNLINLPPGVEAIPGMEQYTATAQENYTYRDRRNLPDTSVDENIQTAARAGNLNRAVESIIRSVPKEVQPLVRRMRSMAAGVTIELESFSDPEVSGRYYYDRKVIALDPERGLNKESLLHELSHAALDRILADPNSKEVKQLFDFYSSIKTQMGDAYGGTDLYEFVAELVGNSEFQNLLKKIKAPKSKSLWETIVDSLLEFFGIRKGQSAYDASFKFLNDIITARPSIEPSDIESIIYANENPEKAFKDKLDSFPPFREKRVSAAIKRARANGISQKALEGSLGALRLDNLAEMFGKYLPSIQKIIDFVEQRQASQEQEIEQINKKYRVFNKLARKYEDTYMAMGKLAQSLNLATPEGVDILGPAPDPEKATGKNKKEIAKNKARLQKQLEEYNKGKVEFDRIGKMEGGKAIQNMYSVMRADFDRNYTRLRTALLANITDPEARKKVEDKFPEEPPIAGYIPATRFGDYVLVFLDPEVNRKVVLTFESIEDRDAEIKARGLTNKFDLQAEINKIEQEVNEDEGTYNPDVASREARKEELRNKKRDTKLAPGEYYTVNSVESLAKTTLPPEGFVADAMDAIRDSGRELGVSMADREKIAESVYSAYVDLFPNNSLIKSLTSRKGVLGPSEDIVRIYGDTMVRATRKIADVEYNGRIQAAFNDVRREAADESNRTDRTDKDFTPETIQAVAKNISSREEKTLNPSFGWLTTLLTSGSYTWFMAGNISSSLVNLSSVPLLTFPILSGRFGGVKTAAALANAGKVAVNEDWGTDPKYKVLYDKLSKHAQLRHTLEREVLEGARKDTASYNTITARVQSVLAVPLSFTERLNRQTTGIMAYDLAREAGDTEEEAAEYALKIVKDVNTSGMSATAPKWMQSDVGRVMWTFKGFIWQSTYVTARAFVQAVAGKDLETKKQAFRQLVYMYGMSYAVGGVFGLPLFGAASVLVNMVMYLADLLDDDEDAPFYFRRELRAMGLSQLILKGPTNEFLGIEVSNRASIANGIGFREEPYEIEKYGYLRSIGLQAFGPLINYLPDAVEGLSEIGSGEFKRGFEKISPSWLRNGIKTSRYLQEGARTRDGRPIVEDLDGYLLFMQSLGFAPADVSETYETRALAKQYENQVMEKRSLLLKQRYLAITTGDRDLRERVEERIRNFRKSYPRLITSDTLQRSIRSRRAAEREYISGIRYSSNFRRELDPLFRRLDNVEYYGLA